MTWIKQSFNMNRRLEIRSRSLVSNEKSIKERLGVRWRTHTLTGRALKLSRIYGAGFAKNFEKSFLQRGVVLDEGMI